MMKADDDHHHDDDEEQQHQRRDAPKRKNVKTIQEEKKAVDDDDSDEERRTLVDKPPFQIDHDDVMAAIQRKRGRKSWWRLAFAGTLVVLLIAGGWFFAYEIITVPFRDRIHKQYENADVPVYSCPSDTLDGDNHRADNGYVKATSKLTANMTEFLATFRESKFDRWGKTYEQVKADNYDWKVNRFSPYIKDGMSIYESACGIGLNLFMTLEILNENKGIEHLHVFGNELLPESADIANTLFDHIAPANGEKGVICAADSTHIEFVPSDAFDLVYTGYISPLFDPLGFGKGLNRNYYDYYTPICEGGGWKMETLNRIAQDKQQDWFGHWVKEMIRIAKPGVPVIIEQVAKPYCEDYTDWGGVTEDWWKGAVETYDWDVDPASVETEAEAVFGNRYNVFMLKNK